MHATKFNKDCDIAFNDSVKEVTNIRTIASAMLESEVYQKMLTEIHKLLALYFTFLVTTSTAESGSFSSLRRLKTYLRNMMNPCRLNDLFLLHVHKSRTDALDLVTIAKKFISANSRRENYFGKLAI